MKPKDMFYCDMQFMDVALKITGAKKRLKGSIDPLRAATACLYGLVLSKVQ